MRWSSRWEEVVEENNNFLKMLQPCILLFQVSNKEAKKNVRGPLHFYFWKFMRHSVQYYLVDMCIHITKHKVVLWSLNKVFFL